MGFRESMLLWLPMESECEEETAHQISLVTAANGAIIDFCDLEQSLDDTLQIIEHYGANVDAYRQSLAEDLRCLGV